MADIVDLQNIPPLYIGIATAVVLVISFFLFKCLTRGGAVKTPVKSKPKKNKDKKDEKKTEQPAKVTQASPKNAKQQKSPAQPVKVATVAPTVAPPSYSAPASRPVGSPKKQKIEKVCKLFVTLCD